MSRDFSLFFEIIGGKGPTRAAGPSGFLGKWGRLPSGGFGFGELRDDAELLH